MKGATGPEPPARDAGRRALLVAEGPCEELSARLSDAGLGVTCVTAGEVENALSTPDAPALLLVAFGEREGESKLVGLARRLRAEPRTFALPLVFLFRTDERTLRSAALRVGADDYFARDAPTGEVRARLEALFWRAQVGRRAAPQVGEQRAEIDNFMFLLDAVSAEARRGAEGAVALVAAGGTAGALAEAHGFLKLNLRRADSVAFYGPTILLAHLPRMDSGAARATLARLREEFVVGRPGADFIAGVASFPADGVEVEKLIEKAEAALDAARVENSPARVLVYEEGGARVAPPTSPSGGVPPEPRRAANVEAAAATRPGAAAAEGRAGGEWRAARGPLKTKRLLLTVSDAARMAQVNLLMRSAGYEVRAAFDGQHALSLLRIDKPDLLLVDYELQGMDGIEMLRRLGKQSGASPTPPSVLLLPAGVEGLRGEALGAGAGAVVGLPYDPLELLDALRGVAGLE
jgi:two-component system, chemotaxis family, chemotaxis protein CheY